MHISKPSLLGLPLIFFLQLFPRLLGVLGDPPSDGDIHAFVGQIVLAVEVSGI